MYTVPYVPAFHSILFAQVPLQGGVFTSKKNKVVVAMALEGKQALKGFIHNSSGGTEVLACHILNIKCYARLVQHAAAVYMAVDCKLWWRNRG